MSSVRRAWVLAPAAAFALSCGSAPPAATDGSIPKVHACRDSRDALTRAQTLREDGRLRRAVRELELTIDGNRLRVELDGNSQESGTSVVYDVSSNHRLDAMPSAPASFVTMTLHDRRVSTVTHPAETTREWNADALGSVDLVAVSDVIEVVAQNESRARLATIAILGEDLVTLFEDGSVALTDVHAIPNDLVCDYGGVLLPFEVCRDELEVETKVGAAALP